MAHIPPPIPIWNLVEHYDMTTKPEVGHRMNLAVCTLFPSIHEHQLHAEIGEFAHKHSCIFTAWKKRNPDNPLLGYKVLIESSSETIQEVFAMGSCHIFDARVTALEPLTVRLSHDTLVISDNKTKTQVWFVELFAGSYGGWSHGLHYLKPFLTDQDDFKVMAVEAHLPHAVNFALSHKYQLVGSTEDMPTSFLRDHPENTIIHCRIQDVKWQQLLKDIHTQAWFISAPCVSWSNAGSQLGFQVPEGQCLADSLGAAKIHRPDYLLLEQVSGFPSHQHYDMFCRLLAWAGYRILHQQCYELASVCPVRRCRWIAICHHESIAPPHVPIARWPRLLTTPQHFDAVLCLDDMQMRQLQPTKEVAAKYWDPNLMPGRKVTWTKQDIVRYRIPSMEEALPTFLAAYASQHDLPDRALQQKGMFGHFIRFKDAFRFFHPLEILLFHSNAKTTLVLKPLKHAYQALGNSIVPPHALFGLYHLFVALDLIPQDLTFTALLVRFLSERLRASRVSVLQDTCAWYIGHPQECQDLKLLLQFYMAQLQWKVDDTNREWPTHSFFHPIKGLLRFQPQELPDTLPFRVAFQILPYMIPGEYGVLKVDGQVTWDVLIHLWHHVLVPKDFLLDMNRLQVPIETTVPDAKILLAPTPEDQIQLPMQETPQRALLLRDEVDLTLYEVSSGTTWLDACRRCLLPEQIYYDMFGQLQDEDEILPFLEVTSQPHIIPQLNNFGELFQHAQQVDMTTWVPNDTDILVILCEGTEQQALAFQAIWMHPDILTWLHSKGRQVSFQRESDTQWRLLLRPLVQSPTVPTPFLRHEMFFKLLQLAVSSLISVEGLPWFIKYRTRHVLSGRLIADCEMALIWDLLRHFGNILEMTQPTLYANDVMLQPSQTTTQTAHEVGQLELALERQTTQIDVTMSPDFLPIEPLDLITHLNWEIVVLEEPSSMHIQYRGDALALNQIATLWQHMRAEDICRQEGFSLSCDPVSTLDPNTIRFHVHAIENDANLPNLRLQLFQQIVHELLGCHMTMPGIPVTFTYRHRTILQIDLHPDTTKRSIDAIVRHAYKILNQDGQPRILLGGIIQDTPLTLRQYAQEHESRHLLINLADPVTLRLVGGGPSKPPTNKQDFAKMVESNVANILLEYDMNLPIIPETVTKLVDKHGLASVHQTVNIQSAARKHEAFQNLCRQANIKLPQGGPRRSLVLGKYQKLGDRRQQKAAIALDPGHYQLKSGFFRNADGTAAALLTQFSPHASGILMTNTETAQDWANVFTTLATDELALYVLGPSPNTQLPKSTVCAPAIHQETGNEVLLNGVLIQFGSKQILTSAASLNDVKVKDTQIASVTVWKSDVDTNTWKLIQDSPVKAIMDMMARDGAPDLLKKAWGRVWQSDGTNATPMLATSVQFHGEFDKTSQFAAMMKRSGFSHVYIQPKGDNGRPDDRWRVIWLPGTARELETKTASIGGTAGLVKSRKGLGIRVESGAFSQAWKILKPDTPEPEANYPSMVFRIYPIPHGVDAAILKDWADQQFHWKIKPIKSTGAKQWIIACDSVPEGFLTFNGQPLLLQRLPQKGTSSPGLVLAGPKVPLTQANTKQTPSSSSTVSSELQTDPWAASAAKLKQESRQVEGPVAGMFQQQDNRIQNLEQVVQKLHVTQQETMKAFQERQQLMEGHLQQHIQQTQQNFDHVHLEHQNIHQTIATAMNKQEERLASAFEDLKTFFSARGTKRSPEEDPAQAMLDWNE